MRIAALASAVLTAAATTLLFAPPAHAQSTCTDYVRTTGNDTTGNGSTTAPWATVGKGINSVAAGDVLCIGTGTYSADTVDSTLPDGTATNRITLRSENTAWSSQAVLDGRTSLGGLDWWNIQYLRFTNPTPTATDATNARILALIGGSNVRVEFNDIYDGRYAGLLVGRASPTSAEWPMNYTIRVNSIHDTDAANVYFNPGRPSSGHLVERNILRNAGTENFKWGWGDHCDGISADPNSTVGYGAGAGEFRYNTLVNAGSGGNLIFAEPGRQAVTAHHNLLVDDDSVREFHVRYDSATATTAWPNGCLGDNITVTDTLAFGDAADGNPAGQIPFSQDFGDAPQSKAREARNVTGTDPQLDSGWVPQNPAAQGYGHAAP